MKGKKNPRLSPAMDLGILANLFRFAGLSLIQIDVIFQKSVRKSVEIAAHFVINKKFCALAILRNSPRRVSADVALVTDFG